MPSINYTFDFNQTPPNYLYIWMRNDLTPFYIGIGRNKRFKNLNRRNAHTLNIVNKMGGIDKVPKKLIPMENWEECCKLEIELIRKYGRSDKNKGPLTNQTDGGEGTINKIVSLKTRQAVAMANSQRIWTENAKQSISDKLKGRVVLKSTREKLSKQFSNIPRPKHVIEAMVLGAKKAIEEGRHGWINTEGHKKHFKEVVQTAAAKWHGSEEGINFHRSLGKESWENRKGTEIQCQFCGRDFITPYPTRAKYCHPNCKQSALRKRRGQTTGTRPNRKKITSPKNWKKSS